MLHSESKMIFRIGFENIFLPFDASIRCSYNSLQFKINLYIKLLIFCMLSAHVYTKSNTKLHPRVNILIFFKYTFAFNTKSIGRTW